jgi:hypothetical protein
MKPFKTWILVLAAIATCTTVGNASNGPETKPPAMEQKAPVMKLAMPTVVTDYVIVKADKQHCQDIPAQILTHTVKFYLELCARITQVNDKLSFAPQWCYRQFSRPPSYNYSKATFNPYLHPHKKYTRQLTC